MTCTMPFECGAIVLVPFPFTDQTAFKRRPAVIISNLAYNNTKPDVVVMAVTSQLRPMRALGEIWVSQWHEAGLLKPSAIKPVFATLEQRLIIRAPGGLQPVDVTTPRSIIAAILG